MEHNLLIISDLHLGEDIRPESSGPPSTDFDQIEDDLVSFLDHYRTQRLDELPWRLVINGDMVDFLSVCLMPEQVQTVVGLHPDDHLYGLGTRPHAATAKMSAVLERHPRVFVALAQFVAAGNELDIVCGNHDAELFWPDVQQMLRQRLVNLAAASAQPDARSAEDLTAAIRFHPWFFFEEGVAWIEHGHQYDSYCSFDAILHPVTTTDDLELTVSSAAMRYVSNHYRPHSGHDEAFTFWGYLAWLGSQGASRALSILGAFYDMNARLLVTWHSRWRDPELVAARRRTHLERLAKAARKVRIPEEMLVRLDNLRHRPNALRLDRIIPALMLDRLAITVVAALTFLALLPILPLGWIPVAFVLLTGSVIVVNQRLALLRETIYPNKAMKRVSRAIRKLVRAPIVVFGHSHDPIAVHDNDGWYFNTGSWLAPPGPRSKFVNALTHLRIRLTKDGPRPELCQWRDGRSMAFTPEPR